MSVISAVSTLAAMFLIGFSIESLADFISICVSISLALSGPGSFAVDNLIRGRKPKSSKEEYLNYDL